MSIMPEEDRRNYLIAYVENELIKIPLIERPNCATFNYDESVWKACVRNYATSLKKRLERGETLNTSIEEHMTQWAIKNISTISFHLYIENRLLQLDLSIQHYLRNYSPDRCFKYLRRLNALPLTPLMLKKHPHIVYTILKVILYHPVDLPPAPEGYSGAGLAALIRSNEIIRQKAEDIYNKFQSFFQVPENMMFLDYFKIETELFENRVKDLPLMQAALLVEDIV